MPIYENIDTTPPKPVKELKYKRGVISWTTEEENDPMQKHFLYCIYGFGKNEAINLDDASKILAIVKDRSYASKNLKGVKVVVTSLDRLQNESSPSSITIR
jgi:hypothetical protein